MKKYHPIYLLLINIVLLHSCTTLKHFEKDNEPIPNLSTVLDGGYKTALYKTNINLRDKHFSGLFYFKVLEDSSYRIIFMSEFGLNFLDLEYKNKAFKTINCQDFINRKVILNTLQNDIRLLIDFPDNARKQLNYKNKKDQSRLLKIKHKKGRTYYFYSQNNELIRILQRKALKHVNLLINTNENPVPQRIEIYHKRIKLNINLNLVNYK